MSDLSFSVDEWRDASTETAPLWRISLIAGALALAVRILVQILTLTVIHDTHLGTQKQGIDSYAYVAQARLILGERVHLSEYDHRGFPGLPVMLAAMHWVGFPFPAAGAILNTLGAIVAAFAVTWITRDLRVGLLAATFTPHWVESSFGVTTEGIALGAICLSLLGWIIAGEKHNKAREWFLLAAICLAATACVVRPPAVFGVLACGAATVVCRRRIRDGIIYVVGTAIASGIILLFLQLALGIGIQGVRVYAKDPIAYGGHLFDWPIKALLYHTIHHTEGQVKNGYVWIHVVLVLFGIVSLWSIARKQPTALLPWMLFIWLLLNSAFTASLGSLWAYSCLPRFVVMAMPPIWYAMVQTIGRGTKFWVGVAVASLILLMALIAHNGSRGVEGASASASPTSSVTTSDTAEDTWALMF